MSTSKNAAAAQTTDASKLIAAPRWLAVLLIITGLLGLLASFSLTLEKLHHLQFPDDELTCSINPWIQCTTNLDSAQGAVFGFPNPIIGLMTFVAPIAVGVLTLAGARFARWAWNAFIAGVFLALVFAMWLASQSLFVLGTLCPWCFVVWMTMFTMSVPVFMWGFGSGALPAPAGLRRFAKKYLAWSWVGSLLLAVILICTAIIRIPQLVTMLF
ncbi:vitamin K epoxide reductase family protein [Humidisolicoccus flavus]|uniref:vitamin K epoxide reductase family protein n=1 Tax=Humidisolicoccus flavus TaxID=3111414 RepID=UPI0032532F30